MVKCVDPKIVNEATGRCVLKTGKIGKKILKETGKKLSEPIRLSKPKAMEPISLESMLKTHKLSLNDAKKICTYLKPVSPRKHTPKKTPSPRKHTPKKTPSPKSKTPSPKSKTPSPKSKSSGPSPRTQATQQYKDYLKYLKNVVGSADKYKHFEDIFFKYIEDKKYDELADLIESFVKNDDFVKNNYNAIISGLEDILELTKGRRKAKDLREYATGLLADFKSLENDSENDSEDDEDDDTEYIALPKGVVKSPSKKLKTPSPKPKLKTPSPKPVKVKRRIAPTNLSNPNPNPT